MLPGQYKRDLQSIEARRQKGMQMLMQGCTRTEVARTCAVSRQTVLNWARMVETDPESWEIKPLGRPAALGASDLRRLSALYRNGAISNGFPTESWTLGRVAALIKDEFGVTFSEANVWHVLRSLGVSTHTSP
jgi:transposase